MPHHDLTSEELAMIREILQRNLPLAMLGVLDDRYESLLNSCELLERQPENGNTSYECSRPGRQVGEGTRCPVKNDDPPPASAENHNRQKWAL